MCIVCIKRCIKLAACNLDMLCNALTDALHFFMDAASILVSAGVQSSLMSCPGIYMKCCTGEYRNFSEEKMTMSWTEIVFGGGPGLGRDLRNNCSLFRLAAARHRSQ